MKTLNTFLFRRKTKNNIPKLVIIFSLVKINFLINNRLFKENLGQSKGNKMTKLGTLFFVLRLTVICLFIVSCGDDKKDIKAYYFPLKALKEQPKVYEYEYQLKDTAIKMYWYYQTVTQGDSIYFVGTCYNDAFQQVLLVREQRFDNGMKLKDLFYFGTDSTGKSVQSKASIEGGAVFPFSVKDDKGVFINILKYNDPKDSTRQTTITRNRRYIKDTSYIYRGISYNAIEFEMKEEQAEKDIVKGGFSHVYTIKEIYAKDIWQVYTKREISEGNFIVMHLVDIYSMQDLESKFKEKNK